LGNGLAISGSAGPGHKLIGDPVNQVVPELDLVRVGAKLQQVQTGGKGIFAAAEEDNDVVIANELDHSLVS
jgi:hypothetical protein